ncbi:MAG: Crp/Fnr family transcriptional regulator [Alphaproteobacteria bacterium BRH_c36]|nr:MAG: Crp/Fnr family transcriptional regulator [Alphaproteobacteria bacterium BRH_c36]
MTENPQFDFSLLAQGNIPVKHFAADEKIFLAGDTGSAMFIVRTGKVAIKTGGMVLENVGPGGLFGEMALIDGSPRSATAVALEPSEIAVVEQPGLLGLIQQSPKFALTVMQLMAQRIRRTNESL